MTPTLSTRQKLGSLPLGARFRTLATGRVGEVVDQAGYSAGGPLSVGVWFEGRTETVQIRAGLIVEVLP